MRIQFEFIRSETFQRRVNHEKIVEVKFNEMKMLNILLIFQVRPPANEILVSYPLPPAAYFIPPYQGN